VVVVEVVTAESVWWGLERTRRKRRRKRRSRIKKG
jgi:hypothetical protein